MFEQHRPICSSAGCLRKAQLRLMQTDYVQYTATVLAVQASFSIGESGLISCRCELLFLGLNLKYHVHTGRNLSV